MNQCNEPYKSAALSVCSITRHIQGSTSIYTHSNLGAVNVVLNCVGCLWLDWT